MLKVNGKNVNEQNIDGVSMLVNYNTNSNTRLVKRMYVFLMNEWRLKIKMLFVEFLQNLTKTPLHEASRYNYVEIVKVLLAFGADKEIKNEVSAWQLLDKWHMTFNRTRKLQWTWHKIKILKTTLIILMINTV